MTPTCCALYALGQKVHSGSWPVFRGLNELSGQLNKINSGVLTFLTAYRRENPSLKDSLYHAKQERLEHKTFQELYPDAKITPDDALFVIESKGKAALELMENLTQYTFEIDTSKLFLY